MKWEHKTKKVSVMVDTDEAVTDARIAIELDTAGIGGWELVAVVDVPDSAHVRAFFKRLLPVKTVIT